MGLGISAWQIQKIFVACSEHHKVLADRIMAGIGGQALKSDGNYSAPKRMKLFINGCERISPTSLQGVVNEINQVMSYQLGGLSEDHDERTEQLREIHERYSLNGGLIEEPEFEIGQELPEKYLVKNSPVAFEDKCCSVAELYTTAVLVFLTPNL